ALVGIVRVRHRAGAHAVLRDPLVRAGGALRQFPLVAEEVPEEVVAPLGRRGRPGAFEAAGDRIAGVARAVGVFPAEALLVDSGGSGLGPNVFRRIGSAMRLAEGMTAGNERDGLIIV